MKTFFIITLLAFGLAGCGGGPTVLSGEVVSKKFTPAHTTIWQQPISHQQYAGQSCTKIGTTQTCTPRYTTYYTYVPVPIFHPNKWEITYRNCNVFHKDGSPYLNKDATNKCFKKTRTVSESDYNIYNTGDHIDFGGSK